jgi:uncharacterized protein YeaC (DUF1315 family)
MDFDKLISSMSPQVHTSLKKAIEVGKWPDGKKLTIEQKELCMEAVLNYERLYVNEEDRVGYIDRGAKTDGEQCDDKPAGEAKEQALKWKH